MILLRSVGWSSINTMIGRRPSVSTSFPPQLIRASAGTGKTYQLTNRYLRLLFAGESPDRILATTFTRKAAQEIYVRVIQRLARAAQSDEQAAELCSDLEVSTCTTSMAQDVLRRVVQEQHRLRILTLDSFCIQLARSFPTELQMEPGWSLLHEDRAKALRVEAIRRICSEGDADELSALVQLLSKGDFGRSIHDKLERDIVTLYELFRESSDAAWSWMRVPEALSAKKLSQVIDQLRVVELPLTKAGEPNKNYVKAHANTLAAIDEQEWEDVIKQGIGKAVVRGESTFSRGEIPQELVDAYRALLPHVRHILLSKLREQTLASLDLLHRFEDQYEGEKKNVSSYSFSDVKHILAKSAFLGEIDEIFFRLDSKLPHILFDEFQDTSRSEWQVLEPLVAETLSHATEEKSFFCVGDVKQAIYGWRGGVSEIFDTLKEKWPHLAEDPMTKSYRSSPIVLDVVNRVFSFVSSGEGLCEHQHVAQKWRAMFQEHSSARTELPGYVELRRVDLGQDPLDDVFEAAIEQIQELHEANPAISIGVLVRRNRHVAQLIFELRSRGIPASEEGGNPLTDSQGVSLILSLLRWIDHPGDTLSLFHVAHSPLGKSLGLTHPISQERCLERNNSLRQELANLGYDGLVLQWAHILAPQGSRREARRLYQLVELAHAFELPASDRTRAFIDFIHHTKVDDPEHVSVRVMTVHQSKGLEFDAVVLPELDKSMLKTPQSQVLSFRKDPLEPPARICRSANQTIRSLDPLLEEMYENSQQQLLHEELCVFYVALTRAKHALYLFVQPKSRASLSYASLLTSALAEKGAEGVLFCAGDKEWYSSLDIQEETFVVSDPQTVTLRPVLERSRALSRKKPSALEGGQTHELTRELQPMSHRAALTGTVIHKLFEMVSWLEDGVPSDEELFLAVASLSHDDHLLTEQITRFRTYIEQEQIAALFSRKGYGDNSRLFPEYSFVYRQESHLVTGTIDRLVLFDDESGRQRAEIIDFKSDLLRGEEQYEEKLSFYQPQLEAYQEAIMHLYGLAPSAVSLKLAFVQHGKVHSVS